MVVEPSSVVEEDSASLKDSKASSNILPQIAMETTEPAEPEGESGHFLLNIHSHELSFLFVREEDDMDLESQKLHRPSFLFVVWIGFPTFHFQIIIFFFKRVNLPSFNWHHQ